MVKKRAQEYVDDMKSTVLYDNDDDRSRKQTKIILLALKAKTKNRKISREMDVEREKAIVTKMRGNGYEI